MRRLQLLFPTRSTHWFVDLLFLAVSAAFLLPPIYGLFRPTEREADGGAWMDGLLGSVAVLLLLLLASVLFVSAIRLFNRARGKYRAADSSMARQNSPSERQ